MSSVHKPDVPSPINLCDPQDAREWERTAQARPGRTEMFQAFAIQLRRLGRRNLRVLDLGGGPGFLAEYLLKELPDLLIHLLDFSQPMLDLARDRLRGVTNVQLLLRDFKTPDWAQGLGKLEVIVTNQAVHELRHKRYASGLHTSVAGILEPGGVYLVCDHFFGDGGMVDNQLYMSIDEQQESLRSAGFASVEEIHRSGSLVMHRAAQPGAAANHVKHHDSVAG